MAQNPFGAGNGLVPSGYNWAITWANVDQDLLQQGFTRP